MKRAAIVIAEAVYNWAVPLTSPAWWDHPFYVIGQASALVLDWLDPIPPRAPRK